MFLTLLCLLIRLHLSASQDVRLVNGTFGEHMGRFEVLYNNTWGTVCSTGWNYNDAKVACRSVGFIGALCSISTRTLSFPLGDDDAPVWMSNLRCRGVERSLHLCPKIGYGVDSCPRIGGEAICIKRGVVGKTTNLTQVTATSFSVRISWKLPPIPAGAVAIRWRIQGFSGNDRYPRTTNVNISTFSFVMEGLSVNSLYSVRVRTDIKYGLCNNFLWGDFSDRLVVSTTELVKQSNLTLRLVPPFPEVDFMGRVEVQYNGTWGTVCRHFFNISAAHAVCRSLNFTKALCPVGSGFGPGRGPIWLDNVKCSRTDEVLDDCNTNNWGRHNCNHRLDVGVICQSNDYRGAVSGLRVLRTGFNTIQLSWNPFEFPPGTSFFRYNLCFKRISDRAYRCIRRNNPSVTQYTLRNLVPNSNYTIFISTSYRFRFCGAFINSARSRPVFAVVVETGPTGPPTSFHVTTLNSTAVEAEWNLPLFQRRNGIIRGYKIFIQRSNENTERLVNLAGGSINEAIIPGLEPSTPYTFSILAYTIADGPRSIYLTVSTYPEDYVESIRRFGINGNGRDRYVARLTQRNLNILCAPGFSGVQLTWFHSNGTIVSRTNRYLNQGRNTAGASVLRIGNGRNVKYCDAGVYMCRAVWNTNTTNTTQGTQSRNFTLLVENSPPSPSTPLKQAVGSTWVTLSWYELSCDGGHNISELNIRYRKEVANYYISPYNYIYNLDPSLRSYTVHDLDPYTAYTFSIRALSAEFQPSDFSDERTISTLLAAPSPPRDVRVRLVKTPTVEISWQAPENPSTIIAFYTVYASTPTIRINHGNNQYSTTSLNETSLRVPGHIGTVQMNVTGSHSYVEFQVSATIIVDGEEDEGERSPITSDSTVFVPSPNLPVPENVRLLEITNTSVSITWNYPIQNFHVPILYFKVAYTARVTSRSRKGVLIDFDTSGEKNVSSSQTRTTIAGLFPDTEYSFRVAAVTQYGQGREVRVDNSTALPSGDKLGYFQMKIHSIPNNYCFRWKLNSSISTAIRDSVLQTLNSALCTTCQLPPSSMKPLPLSCSRKEVNQAVFRAMITGTNHQSSSYLIDLMDTWVLTNTASVTLPDGGRFRIDATCPVILDSPRSPVCSNEEGLATSLPPTSSSASPTDFTSSSAASPTDFTEPVVVAAAQNKGLTPAEAGGIVIGVVIILLLVVFVILLVLLLVRSYRNQSSTIGMKKLTEEDVYGVKDPELKHDNPIYAESEDKAVIS